MSVLKKSFMILFGGISLLCEALFAMKRPPMDTQPAYRALVLTLGSMNLGCKQAGFDGPSMAEHTRVLRNFQRFGEKKPPVRGSFDRRLLYQPESRKHNQQILIEKLTDLVECDDIMSASVSKKDKVSFKKDKSRRRKRPVDYFNHDDLVETQEADRQQEAWWKEVQNNDDNYQIACEEVESFHDAQLAVLYDFIRISKSINTLKVRRDLNYEERKKVEDAKIIFGYLFMEFKKLAAHLVDNQKTIEKFEAISDELCHLQFTLMIFDPAVVCDDADVW